MSLLHPNVEAGLGKLKSQGHTVSTQIRGGQMWFEIDRRMLASYQEMGELGASVYSLSELEELFIKRREEHAGQ